MLDRIFGKKSKAQAQEPPHPPQAPVPTQTQIDERFLFSVKSHNLSDAKKWAAMGADINHADGKHTPALISSLRDKQPEITDWLLTLKPDLERQDRFEKTALMTAVDNGAGWVDKILKAGARLDTVNGKGWTALEYALRQKHSDSAIALIDAAEKLQTTLSDGNTVADYARENGLDAVTRKIAQKERIKAEAEREALKPEAKKPVPLMKTIRFRKG